MRKESDEEDEFYDRTMKPQEMMADEKEKYKEQAKGKNFDDLKRQLEALISEKAEVNEGLAKIAHGERSARVALESRVKGDEEDLDRMIREDEAALRVEQRARLIERMKAIVKEIEE